MPVSDPLVHQLLTGGPTTIGPTGGGAVSTGGVGGGELADLFTFYGIDPRSPVANIIRQRIADGEPANDVFLEIAALSQTGPFAPTAPTPGPGRAPPAFTSTQEAQTQNEAFQREQAEILAKAREDELRRAEEQREIDRELRLREARLTAARDLVNIRSAEAREARTQGTQLAGSDPFRFLAVARGLQPPTGTTPSAAFKENLLGAAQFQAPELGGLDSNALESVINKLSDPLTQGGSPTFGFAHGGVLSPNGAQSGTGAQAVPVGENGPEIMILRPDGSVEVVPLQRGAQGGGVFDLGGFGPLFGRLRESIGLPSGDPSFGFRSAGLPQDAFRSQFGFLGQPTETQETSAPFQAFAGPVLNIRSGLREAFQFQGVPQAGTEAQRISRLIGLLPAPFKIPPTFFQSLLPAEQSALVSAYRFAGVPEADFRHLLTVAQLPANPIRATAVG